MAMLLKLGQLGNGTGTESALERPPPIGRCKGQGQAPLDAPRPNSTAQFLVEPVRRPPPCECGTSAAKHPAFAAYGLTNTTVPSSAQL
jgi:hypothetical protein